MQKGNIFDDKRIDMMMERYREEILRMQRAKPPVANFEKKDKTPVIIGQPSVEIFDVDQFLNHEDQAEKQLPQEIICDGNDEIPQIKDSDCEEKEESADEEMGNAEAVLQDSKEEKCKEEEKKENGQLKEKDDKNFEIDQQGVQENDEGENNNEEAEDSGDIDEKTPPSELSKDEKSPMMEKFVQFMDKERCQTPTINIPNNDLTEIYEQKNKNRIMFNKGICTVGTFKPYDKGNVTKAFFMDNSLEGVNAAVRFSSDGDERTPDCFRGEKLLELKLFNEKEQCDLFFFSLPVLFYESFTQLCQFLSCKCKNKETGLFDYSDLWEYVCRYPDALDACLYYFSDLGTPSSYRTMSYYTLPMVSENSKGEKTAVRFVLTPANKEKPFSNFEAQEAAGCDEDYLQRDVFTFLKGRNKIIFELGVQEIPENKWQSSEFSIFNPQCIWKVSEINVKPIGMVSVNSLSPICQSTVFRIDNLCDGLYMPKTSLNEEAVKTLGALSQMRTGIPYCFDEKKLMEVPDVKGGRTPYLNCRERVGFMEEREARRLRENLCSSMKFLDGNVLEESLVLMTKLDFAFGKSLMNMIEA